MLVCKKALLKNILTDLVAEDDGRLDGAKIGLIRADIIPTRENVVADFEVSTFNGVTDYTAIVWGTPFINDDSQAEVLGGLISWLTTSDPDAPVTVYGYVIVNTDHTDWFLAERFSQPYNFVRTGQPLQLVPRVVLDV